MSTIVTIVKEKSVGTLPLLPYSTMVVCNLLWIAYGVLTSESKILLANGIGLVLGLFYFVQFLRFAPPKSPTLPGTTRQHVHFVVGTVVTVILYCWWSNRTVTVQAHSAAQVLGTAGVMFSVALFASPLAALKVVMETKSGQSIPMPFTVASIINNVLWGVVGWADMKDFNVWFQAALGLGLGLIQLALKLWYSHGARRRPSSPIRSQLEVKAEHVL
jgi:solute carrier family 50 protein (sugar transporter)